MRKWLLALAKRWKIAAPALLIALGGIYRLWSNWQRSKLADLESAKRRAELKDKNLQDENTAAALRAVMAKKGEEADHYKKRAEELGEELKSKEADHARIVEERLEIEKAIAEKRHSADELDALAKSLKF